MVKLASLLLMMFMVGCTGPHMVKSSFEYDYVLPSDYPLTRKHQRINVSIDDETLKRPESILKYEALNLGYSTIVTGAQVVAFIHFQPSFFVQREPITRQIIKYDEKDKGHVVYVITNRGFIRTPYSVELVDALNDTLIFQTQGAGNYSIDAAPYPNNEQTKKALLDVFHQYTFEARQTLLNDIWEKLKGRYLQDIQVTFAKMKFKLVSEHESEPVFKQAFALLKKNDKVAAKQALAIYNQAYKRYQAKEDNESKLILSYINDGITAATQIVNDPNPQRYIQ
jgi:hypothetical protein